MSSSIKQAVASDCERLIELFANAKSYEFQSFCTEWRRMHFRHIYSGQLRDVEFIQMTEEIFRAVSRFLLENQGVPQRIGALYLIYAVYFKQPTEQFVKFKVTLEQWKNLKELIDTIKNDPETVQVRYIFYKLLASNAFRFVFMENDRGLESSFKCHQMHRNANVQHTTLSSVFENDMRELTHPTKGYLESLGILEGGYNEMKEIMNQRGEETDSAIYQSLDITNIMDQIKASVSKISDILCSNGGNEDVVENQVAETTEKQQKKPSIRKTRENIRKKAKSHRRIGTEDGGFDISLNDDMIQIISKGDDRIRANQQNANKLFGQELPDETLNELNYDESLDLDDSANQQTVRRYGGRRKPTVK